MVFVQGGVFGMGSFEHEAGRYDDEGPVHVVAVQGFYMSKYEVTQAQWLAVMGYNPSHFKGDDHPVERVSWDKAVEFCQRMSRMTGKQYRLPSEAEWEYACRAGTTTPFAFGPTLSAEHANFNGNYPYGGAPKGVDRRQTTRVGSYPPNAFGLYDMYGNVWEWVQDYAHKNYDGAPADGSAWVAGRASNNRVVRGCSWTSPAVNCRSANRDTAAHETANNDLGFRVVYAGKP